MNDFSVLQYPADTGGCAHYRCHFPMWLLRIISPIKFIDSMRYILDPKFYIGLRMVKLQRQVNDIQAQFFLNFLKPLSESLGFYIVYEVDDVITYEDIPPYNIAKSAYDNKQFFINVKNMLNASDFITVTTVYLKNHYVKKYEINPDKILVIPNYLPRWWIGETYQGPEHQMRLYDENIKKPRIGFPCSSSHFDLKGQNNYIDDFTHIVDFIKSTVNKYQWVFIGGIPKQLEKEAIDKKIEVHHPSDLLNYPRELWMKKLNAIIAPLQDNEFNRAKSNIKLLESWSLGIPCIAQNLICYNQYTDMVFNNVNDLQNQLDNLFKDRNKYKKIIKEYRSIIDFGRSTLPGLENGAWLEKNIDWQIDSNINKGKRGGHLSLFTTLQKTIYIDLKKIKENMNIQNIQESKSLKLEL